MRSTRLNKFFVPRLLGLMVVTLCIFVSGGIALGYVSCDGVHTHDDTYYRGKWFGCLGSAWRDASDSYKIYMRCDWSEDCALYARDYIEGDDGCIEIEFHYDNNNITNITWGCNSSSATLDYDTGDYHVDIHAPLFGTTAVNSGYIQTWLKTNRSDIIGTQYVVQYHVSPSGKYCGDYTWGRCGLGAYRGDADGILYDWPREWYSSWTNGDRH